MSAGTIPRSQSIVEAFDAAGQLYKGFHIWTDRAPSVKADKSLCYVKCLVLDGSTPSVLKCRQIEPFDPSQKEFDIPAKFAYNVNVNVDPLNFPDVGMIPHTNDIAALDFIRQRYIKGQIYTEARPLLVSVNPYKDLGNTSNQVILQYRDTPDLEKLPPHVFSIARVALENINSVRKSQTIIVSGESGAGKTEAVKQVMRYFAATRRGARESHIQNAVLAANPILEAFGNAKTIRNNNSSRFGRFVQLQVSPEGGIEYGRVSSFLLEKSRIITQENDERSYHIFYQLLKGSDPQEKLKYRLRSLNEYKLLNPKSHQADGIDDVKDWSLVKSSLRSMLLTPAEMDSIFSIASGILLLGNVQISQMNRFGIPDAAGLDARNQALLKEACGLLFLDAGLVEKWMFTKVSKAGTEQVVGCWKQSEANVLKDSLSKGIYEKLFEWIIQKLNTLISPPEDFKEFLALLDIFGFEVFHKNSLEQLLINITNEMLQKNFIDAVFDRETKLYRAEKICSTELVWTSNDEVIEVLTGRGNSVMTALEDQCLAPNGSDEKFILALHRNLKDSSKVSKSKVGPNINFVIEHTIGSIGYCAANFLSKSKDVLSPDLAEVIQQSKNPVASACFKDVQLVRGRLAKGQLIGSKFLVQLKSLMSIINTTEPHFIRCVKPNETKSPLVFEPCSVKVQLHSLSVFEALQLRNLGFSYRRPFEEFIFQYQFVHIGIAKNTEMTAKQRAEALLVSQDISEDSWRIGETMVFMKNSATKQMTKLQRESLSCWSPIIETIEALLLKSKYRKQYNSMLPLLTRIQARCRQKICQTVLPLEHSVCIKGWA